MKMASVVTSLDAMSLQFECARVLHEGLLVSVLIYGSDKIVWKEYERSMIMAM